MKFLRLLNILRISGHQFFGPHLLSSLLLGLMLTGCATTETFDATTPDGAYLQAEALEKDERYEEAIQRYADVKNKHPYSRFATMSEMKIADLHFKRESYIEAQNAYQLFKEFHPTHPQLDYVTFRLALSYFNQLPPTTDRDLTLADKAILYFDETARSFPNSEYAKEAGEKRQSALKMLAEKEMYVAGFYDKKRQYDSSLKRYETVLKTYPSLGFDAPALYGAARSAYENGEKDRGSQHLKNLYSLYPSSDEAKRARDEFKKYGAN